MSKSWMVVLGALALFGCNQRRSEPFVGPLNLDATQAAGERLFFVHCNECHPLGESGLGPSLNDKPVPDAIIKNQVRHPVAFMPPFSEAVLPKEQLDALVEYVKALRRARADN